jgi:hypothetical protein
MSTADAQSQIYPYSDNIKSPGELGYQEKGDVGVFVKDVEGILNYTEFLFNGKGMGGGQGNPSKTNRPLGNSFFLATAGQCTDQETGEVQNRSVYMNFLPDVTIPGASGSGLDLSNTTGLIPGMFLDLAKINPLSVIQGIFLPPNPPCIGAKLKVVGNDNVTTYQTGYIITEEARNIDPCVWDGNVNKVSGNTCKSGFTTLKGAPSNASNNSLSYAKYHSYSYNNYGREIYLLLKVIFMTFILYFIYRILVKMRLIPDLTEFD